MGNKTQSWELEPNLGSKLKVYTKKQRIQYQDENKTHVGLQNPSQATKPKLGYITQVFPVKQYCKTQIYDLKPKLMFCKTQKPCWKVMHTSKYFKLEILFWNDGQTRCILFIQNKVEKDQKE